MVVVVVVVVAAAVVVPHTLVKSRGVFGIFYVFASPNVRFYLGKTCFFEFRGPKTIWSFIVFLSLGSYEEVHIHIKTIQGETYILKQYRERHTY